ncbi:2-amino-4-hydroxy-6-hydroxymethyldihydropteridine diphosphokinase [Epibacterium sp. SM1969]|uniref:2-amino-4-hydroxy-6-hydroxymethyldihydropteridine pyrophosphokinase n=1 Tax=Tritonibacter aquimaris TaxID=2663379 RepID=A0A844AW05_9RHOB|nr:2-amino-4-hydroxy-6-hydroxymethyldihydropteridine diphosphokinase [Tritonibacter aquimaris]MQY42171.1 2-amino-4-hydroxy-6-hydroxymethyldihydropteridine diphosphokinase [Tritonibacter aquimaris]
MTKNTPEVLIALGGNLPFEDLHPRDTILSAVNSLSGPQIEVVRESRLFKTPCFPKGAGPDYVNAAVVVRSDLAAPEILDFLHSVEAKFDRERITRWGMRTLDLDLLAVGDQIAPDSQTFAHWLNLGSEAQKTDAPEQLILPHPRLQDRGFVLVPLMDVAPDWVHPVLKRSVRQMVEALPAEVMAEIEAI